MTAAPSFHSGPAPYPEKSRAAVVLVLGILGIAATGILGPLAWWMGNRELAAIDAGSRSPDGRDLARAGRLLGIVGTLLIAAAVALFVLALVGVITVP